MNQQIIKFIIQFIFYIAIIAFIPLQKKTALKNAGKKITALPKEKILHPIQIMLLAFLILVINIFLKFETYINFVLVGCAYMGTYIATKELSFHGIEGLYENCIIGNSAILNISQIDSIPEILAADEEKEFFHETTLIIKKTNGKFQNYIFKNPEEKQLFINKLVKSIPHLSKK